jgi:glycerol-3-phosphate cytidylyltransferase
MNDDVVGLIAGAFDIMHPGYVLAFKHAKESCNHLVVALHVNTAHERSTKTNTISSIFERQIVLSGLKDVDDVLVYQTEQDLEQILRVVKPHVRFLGDDYKDKVEKTTGYDINIQNGTKIIFIERDHGFSTTEFKKRIVQANVNKQTSELPLYGPVG